MRETVLDILREIDPDTDFEHETALIDHEILDSFSVIRLVTELMDRYDIELDADDLEPENLNSVDAIVAMILRKQEA